VVRLAPDADCCCGDLLGGLFLTPVGPPLAPVDVCPVCIGSCLVPPLYGREYTVLAYGCFCVCLASPGILRRVVRHLEKCTEYFTPQNSLLTFRSFRVTMTNEVPWQGGEWPLANSLTDCASFRLFVPLSPKKSAQEDPKVKDFRANTNKITGKT